MPILLARSLENGPAVWYLTDACRTEGYAICEMFDAVPDNVTDFLWTDDGIRAATDAQRQRLRDEEFTILYRTFRAYPLAQAEALFGNVLKQSVAVGTGQLLPPSAADLAAMEMRPRSDRDAAEDHPALVLFDGIVPLGTLPFALLLAGLAAAGRLSRDLGEAAVLVIAALAVNAAIFGGLSYPVDRYQSRIVWLLGAIAAIALAGPKNSGLSIT